MRDFFFLFQEENFTPLRDIIKITLYQFSIGHSEKQPGIYPVKRIIVNIKSINQFRNSLAIED